MMRVVTFLLFLLAYLPGPAIASVPSPTHGWERGETSPTTTIYKSAGSAFALGPAGDLSSPTQPKGLAPSGRLCAVPQLAKSRCSRARPHDGDVLLAGRAAERRPKAGGQFYQGPRSDGSGDTGLYPYRVWHHAGTRPVRVQTLDLSGAIMAQQALMLDWQGSVVAAVDETSGQLMDRYRYSPYGLPSEAAGLPIRYTGHYYDAELGEAGLYYARARVYDPLTGRFHQTDPIGYEDDLNWYAYVKNDPVNAIDPTGEACESTDGTTTCTPEDSTLPAVSFPTPEGWQDFDADSANFHDYRVDISAGQGDSEFGERLTEELVNDPTPGNDSPATPGGTTNNADISIFTSPDDVSSFTIETDQGTAVVNVTQDNHALKSGFVLRMVVPDGKGGFDIVNYGEGNAFLQTLPGATGAAKGAWRSNSNNVISRARRR